MAALLGGCRNTLGVDGRFRDLSAASGVGGWRGRAGEPPRSALPARSAPAAPLGRCRRVDDPAGVRCTKAHKPPRRRRNREMSTPQVHMSRSRRERVRFRALRTRSPRSPSASPTTTRHHPGGNPSNTPRGLPVAPQPHGTPPTGPRPQFCDSVPGRLRRHLSGMRIVFEQPRPLPGAVGTPAEGAAPYRPRQRVGPLRAFSRLRQPSLWIHRSASWRTSSLKSDESSSAATAGSFVRSGLGIVRAMQSSRQARRDS